MNLNAIAAGATRAITPALPATLYVSTGSTTADDGTRTPLYHVRTRVTADVRSLTGGDLRQLDALNLQTANCAAYLSGDVEGINRNAGKGGDLLRIAAGPNAGLWLVVTVLETWPDWCKVALVQQVDEP